MRLLFQTNWRLLALGLPFWLLAGSGCKVMKQTAQFPVRTVKGVVPGTQPVQADPATLQADLQRYADDFGGRTAAALDEYVRRVNTPEAQIEALKWKCNLNSAALNIATGPNPVANLLDFLALATLSRSFLEQRAGPAGPPEAMEPWVHASRSLEVEAWKMAERVLTTKQLQECRAAIGHWFAQHTNTVSSFWSRPQDFASAIRETGEAENREPGSIFSLVGLDPTSGLDPAVREVTRTRLFAERALFAAERAPVLMRWQVELLSAQLLRQEQVQAGLQSAERLSRAAESASQTAARLPEQLRAERQAILEALEGQEGKLRELSGEVGRTLTAGEKMSASLNTTVISFDGLMKRFGVGEPPKTPPKTNTPPFNILDYARTAEQVGVAAQQLDALIKDASGTVQTPALDKRLARVSALSSQMRADAKSVVNHLFLLLAGLLVLGFACALAYRRFSPRLYTTAVHSEPPPRKNLPGS